MDLLLGFLLAMSVTMALIPPLMQAAARLQFLDRPNQRKVHSTPVPRVGGIAMAAGLLLALAFSGSYAQPMPAYLVGVFVLLVFGVWDDRATLAAAPKFLGQAIAVLVVMLWGDVGIDTITLTERHELPALVVMPLTFLFLIGVTNAINLADGLDGLAGGTTLLSSSALALLALSTGSAFVGAVAIVIIGAILGFLRFNTHPARVFMGDGGSQVLGYSVAVLAVVLTQSETTALSSALPLLLLGVPIIDTLMVMCQRMMQGKSPFQADQRHVHHRLLSLGFDHHEAVVAIYVLQGTLLVAAWFMRYESDAAIVTVFGALLTGIVALLHIATAGGWEWRPALPTGVESTSPMSRLVGWLARSEHVPRWSLLIISMMLATYMLSVAWVCPSASQDVRWMAGLLAAVIAILIGPRWRAPAAAWLHKAVLYVAVVMAVYFDRQTITLLELQPPLELLTFALLVIAIALRFRLSGERPLRLTSLDVLVLFIAIVVPNLPGSIATSATLGVSIAKLIALMYAVETITNAGVAPWRLASFAALGFLANCALRGMI